MHSTADYAADHLEGEAIADEAAVLAEMQAAVLAALEKHGGRELSVSYARLFAWDHAQPTQAMEQTHLLDPTRLAGLCGDFFLGSEVSGVEAAALSGAHLAEDMAARLLPKVGRRSEL